MMVAPVRLNVREVKRRTNFVAIAGRYTRLRRAGRQFVGLCPFHSERHPSFYVHPEKKIFYCFGCQAGGDLFDFVMLAECCDFSEALRMIVSGFSATKAAKPPEELGRAGFARPSYIARKAETRADVLAKLEATNRRLRAIEAVNRAASARLATACEPERSLSTCTQRITPFQKDARRAAPRNEAAHR